MLREPEGPSGLSADFGVVDATHYVDYGLAADRARLRPCCAWVYNSYHLGLKNMLGIVSRVPASDALPSPRWRVILLPFVLLVFVLTSISVSPNLTAQQASPAAPTAGTITGHVRGPGNVPVPGATVLLVDAKTGERKETWSDEAGNYAVSGIAPGTYKLEVSLVGFRPDVREPIPIAAGKALRVNVALVMGATEQAAAG